MRNAAVTAALFRGKVEWDAACSLAGLYQRLLAPSASKFVRLGRGRLLLSLSAWVFEPEKLPGEASSELCRGEGKLRTAHPAVNAIVAPFSACYAFPCSPGKRIPPSPPRPPPAALPQSGLAVLARHILG